MKSHVYSLRYRWVNLAPNHDLVMAVVAVCFLATCGVADEPGTRITGITRPFKDETVTSSVSGTIEAILVKEGARLTKGQVLIELDSKQEELEVARRQLLWKSKVEEELAGARLATVKADLEGTRQLYETTKSVSKDDLAQKELEHKIAAAELQRITIAEERERIEYDIARDQLRRRTIKAPFDGIVTKIDVEVGENCEPRQALINLVDVSKFYFIGNIPASLACDLKQDQRVTLEVKSGRDSQACIGTISFISPVVDAASALQEVKVLVENNEHGICPGVSGIMHIPVSDESQ